MTDTSNNEVFLRGRLGADVVQRELPSGDPLTAFRLTVERAAGSRVRVDSIDCSATAAKVRRVLERVTPGDELEITGALRRRFWRGPNGLASRYEVEVATAKVTSKAAAKKTEAARKTATSKVRSRR